MTITVTHQKVSAVSDTGTASFVRPSDWNATHTVTGVVDSATTLTAGTGLTGGGDLTTNRTFAVNEAATFAWTGNHTFDTGTVTFNNNVRFPEGEGILDASGGKVIAIRGGGGANANYLSVTNGALVAEVRLTAESGIGAHAPMAFATQEGDSFRWYWGTGFTGGHEYFVNSNGQGINLSFVNDSTTQSTTGDAQFGLSVSGGNGFCGAMYNGWNTLGTDSDWRIYVAGNSALFFGTNGLQLMDASAPTGGYKGGGTINMRGDIYKNNSAYTNPDYALEHHFNGKIEKFAENEGAKDYQGLVPLDEVEQRIKEDLRLPNMHKDPMGAFERSDKVLEKLEEAWIYIAQLHARVKALEEKDGVSI